METTAVTNRKLINQLIFERRAYLVRVAAIIMFLVCGGYSFFWYFLKVPQLTTLCAVFAVSSIVLFFHDRLMINQKIAAHSIKVAGLACIYMTVMYTWSVSLIAIGYLPVMIVGTFLLAGRYAAVVWTFIDMLLALSIPWLAPYFADNALPASFVNVFNMVNVVTIVAITAMLVYLFESLSDTVIAELVNIKTKMEDVQSNLIKVQHYRNRFFASISHEIRTPMNAVRGISELLSKNEALMQQEGVLVGALQRSSNHLLSVVNDLLDVSKLEVGSLRIVETDFDLYDAIGDAYTIAQYAAQEKKLEFSYSIAPNVPRYVAGDANRLRQVLVNLLTNAVKFTDQGSVSLSCTLTEGADADADANAANRSDTYLRVEVKDTGIGIPASMQEKIFDEYYQIDGQVDVIYGGTGLGLYIAKRILKQQGGKIGLHSVVGEGSIFYFELPLKSAKKMLQQVTPLPEGGLAPALSIKASTIMVVEDNSINVLVVKSLINANRSEVKYLDAGNGAVALALLEAGKMPDLILMDVKMPVMDGIEATKKIRAHFNPKIANLKIIAMTANVAEEDVEQCLSAGMNDFIAKPIDPKVLLLKLQHYLQEPPKL
ncbi:MAG: ATP-binding protein [Cytophagales bacterium]|nr:ATP-binding protein [Cytophagales bacterium]